ncbi:MAG: universal stress protein [Gammaproteobacteria bacterium]|nr:universal stress protein [Gammaproteobacteria bacterium]
MTSKKITESILVPVDFSAHSEAALLFAVECADKMGASITVLHVIHDLGEAPGYYSVKGRKKQLRRMEDVASEMLDAFIQEIQEKHPDLPALHNLKTILIKGLPVNRILEIAEQTDSRMIVMGSQGRTGLSHIMLGSKAEQVVRLSPIPVTIVKQQKTPE